MNFHVLGCGPAGLMSAHAAVMLGYTVSIHSKKRKSEMYGAQYLHRPIPLISKPEEKFEVSYVLQGTEEEYRRKVYGPTWNGTVSPEDLTEAHPGWDIRAAYDRLWGLMSELIIDTEFKTPADVARLIDRYDDDHVWASSIPATVLCGMREQHSFASQEVYAIGDAPERGIFCPIEVQPQTVFCNGETVPSWYRASNILGYRTAEWPEGKKPPIEGVAKITKPLATTCDCLPFVHRVGRYGKWEKGVLSHSAFYETFAGLGGNEEELQKALSL